MTDTPEVIHNVTVVPAKDGRAGLWQAVCTCGWEGRVEYESKAHRSAAHHHTSATQNQA